MRRIKGLTTGLLIFLCTFFCSGQDFLSYSTESECGVLNGQLHEYVIYTNDNNELCTLSRLDWDITNLWYIGNTFTYTFNDKLAFSFAYRTGTNQKSGIMQDYDWQDTDRPDYLTNYSSHENNLTSYSKVSLNLSYRFALPVHIAFVPVLSWENETYDFLATNGYFDYTKDIYDGRKGTFTGPVIAYAQTYSTFRAGLSIQTDNLKHFDAAVTGFIVPAFCMNGYDDHLVRVPVLHWWDEMSNGIMLQGNAYFNFIFNSHFKMGLNGGIQYIPFMYGKTYQGFGNLWIDIHSMGGGARTVWNAGAAFTITL